MNERINVKIDECKAYQMNEFMFDEYIGGWMK